MPANSRYIELEMGCASSLNHISIHGGRDDVFCLYGWRDGDQYSTFPSGTGYTPVLTQLA